MSLIPPSYLIDCLGWTLLDFLWQGLLIAGLLRAILAFVPGSKASVRYCLCYGALLFCAFEVLATFAYLTEISSSFSQKEFGGVSSLTPIIASKLAVLDVQWGSQINLWLKWLVLAWLVGVLVGLLRFGLALAQVRSLARSTCCLHDIYWEAYIKKLSRQLGVNQVVCVVSSVATDVPLVLGLLKPTILLPVSLLSQLSTEQIECILAHEMAHICRNDYLVNICQVIIESILFYHPAVWWIGREIRREREYCCDDLALSTHSNVVLYAKALASLEQRRTASLENSLSLAASDGSLVQRIRRIISSSKPGGQNSRASRSMSFAPLIFGTIFLALTSILLLLLTAFSSTALAQTSIPPKPIDAPLVITAGALANPHGEATFSDDVVCTFGGYRLKADHLTVLKSTALAQSSIPTEPTSPSIVITSGVLANHDGEMTFSDNVFCSFGGYTLKADHLIFNPKTKAFQCTGHAKLTRPN